MIRFKGIIALAIMLGFVCGAVYYPAYGRFIRVAVSAEDRSDSNNAAPQTQEILKELYPNGTVKTETPLLNGKTHGKKKLFSESGSVLKEEEYRDGKKEGLSIEYYEDGAVKSHEAFREDRQNGDCFMNYPNGQKMMAGQCADGKKTGKWTLFHNNGNKYMEGNYAEGVMDGVWRSFSPEGWLDSEGEYRNGLQADVWVYYDKYKKVTKKLTMKNGMIDGPCWIYSQGRLVGEGIMNGLAHDPRKNGGWKAYYRNGQLKYEGTFVMGRRNGRFTEYHPDGKVKATGDYINDRRNGNWTFYEKDGVTINAEKTGQYINGKLRKQ